MDLKGIFPPITTPFNKDGSIAEDKLVENLTKWDKIPFKGYLVEGSNGEYVSLSYAERVHLVRKVKETVRPGKLILGGAGCEGTRETIEMCRQMAASGADAVMVVTPSYYKGRVTNDGMKCHYEAVANHSPVPVILYSVPSNTSIDLAPEVVEHMASHPNVVGMKESGGDITKISRMVYETKQKDPNFQMLAGSSSFLLPSYFMGCVGGVCALANVLGEEVCRLHDLYTEGHVSEAVALQYRLIEPNTAVTKLFGVPGVKAAMDMFGFYGGSPRLPMLPLSFGEAAIVRKTFLKHGFIPTTHVEIAEDTV